MHECGHAVSFQTQKLAESTLGNYKPPEAQAGFEVVECSACGWWLIKAKG